MNTPANRQIVLAERPRPIAPTASIFSRAPRLRRSASQGSYAEHDELHARGFSRRLSVRGLVASGRVQGRVKVSHQQMKAWTDEGRIEPMEDIVAGLEQAPVAFQGVFEGRNRGTRLVKVAD